MHVDFKTGGDFPLTFRTSGSIVAEYQLSEYVIPFSVGGPRMKVPPFLFFLEIRYRPLVAVLVILFELRTGRACGGTR